MYGVPFGFLELDSGMIGYSVAAKWKQSDRRQETTLVPVTFA